MCGRFTHRYTWAEIHRLYRLTSPASNVQPSYNVCPTDTVNVVTSVQDTRILQPNLAGRMKRRWRVVLLRAKGEILGEVEAPDVASAKAAAADRFELDEPPNAGTAH